MLKSGAVPFQDSLRTRALPRPVLIMHLFLPRHWRDLFRVRCRLSEIPLAEDLLRWKCF